MRRPPAGRGARGGRGGGGRGVWGAAALAFAGLLALEVLLFRPEVQSQISHVHVPSLAELQGKLEPALEGATRGSGAGAAAVGGAESADPKGREGNAVTAVAAERGGAETGAGSRGEGGDGGGSGRTPPGPGSTGGAEKAAAAAEAGDGTKKKAKKKKRKKRGKKKGKKPPSGGKVGGGGVTGEVEFAVAAEAALKDIVVPHSQKWVSKVNHLMVNQERPEKGFELDSLPAKDLQVRYQTCAVVGNSGMLQEVRWGAAIDAHDAVFRFNDGPTAGFEAVSGSRTTYRLINNKWTRRMADKGDPKGASQENVVLFGIRSRSRLEEIVAATSEETAVYVMGADFAKHSRHAYHASQKTLSEMRYVEVVGKNQAPSGIEGIFMALELCAQIRIYGFGVGELPPEAALRVPYHYHDKVEPDEGAHSFSFQSEFLKVLEYGGHVTLCGPGLNVGACSGAPGAGPLAVAAAAGPGAAAAP